MVGVSVLSRGFTSMLASVVAQRNLLASVVPSVWSTGVPRQQVWATEVASPLTSLLTDVAAQQVALVTDILTSVGTVSPWSTALGAAAEASAQRRAELFGYADDQRSVLAEIAAQAVSGSAVAAINAGVAAQRAAAGWAGIATQASNRSTWLSGLVAEIVLAGRALAERTALAHSLRLKSGAELARIGRKGWHLMRAAVHARMKQFRGTGLPKRLRCLLVVVPPNGPNFAVACFPATGRRPPV